MIEIVTVFSTSDTISTTGQQFQPPEIKKNPDRDHRTSRGRVRIGEPDLQLSRYLPTSSLAQTGQSVRLVNRIQPRHPDPASSAPDPVPMAQPFAKEREREREREMLGSDRFLVECVVHL